MFSSRICGVCLLEQLDAVLGQFVPKVEEFGSGQWRIVWGGAKPNGFHDFKISKSFFFVSKFFRIF